MKKLALCAAFALSPVVAVAADLPKRTQSPVAPIARAYDWTGFYVGANAGYGIGSEKDPYVTPVIGSMDIKGGLFGVQAGYNQQFGNYVLGAEADYAWTKLSDSYSISAATVLNGSAISAAATLKTEQVSLGTVRLRAGYAFDNLLVYATGGYAYGKNKITVSGTASWQGVNWAAQAGNDQVHNGWALGLGGEYGFTKNITAKAEYLHIDLGKKTYWGGTVVADKVNLRNDIFRVGLNYKF